MPSWRSLVIQSEAQNVSQQKDSISKFTAKNVNPWISSSDLLITTAQVMGQCEATKVTPLMASANEAWSLTFVL